MILKILVWILWGLLVLYGLLGISNLVALPMVFKKAKQPWWACFVPIYNVFIWVKIAQRPLSWAIAMVALPFVTLLLAFFGAMFSATLGWTINIIGLVAYLYFIVFTMDSVSEAFDFPSEFTVMCFLFFNFLFFPLIAFTPSEYEGEAKYS